MSLLLHHPTPLCLTQLFRYLTVPLCFLLISRVNLTTKAQQISLNPLVPGSFLPAMIPVCAIVLQILSLRFSPMLRDVITKTKADGRMGWR